ncbi:hypothetical protein [Ralstonia soli]|uniref:Uncharacterized protein n=1 Tax=Ralstonia soli TaxID=2953896 RepID=A0ABT1ASQ8_9RALS|nr:hypothetical protein [Ralstonia soli]MCO5401512.1 hypothetical protein [Ralstonia soli]
MTNELDVVKVLVNKTLVQGSAKGAEKLDAFSGWMLTAFGAMLAFLLGKISDLSPYLAKATLPGLVRLFLIALVAGVLAKYAAMVVSVLGASTEAGESAVKSMGGNPVNVDSLMAEYDKTAWGLNAWAVRWVVRRMRVRDFTCTGRIANRILQLQAVLSACQSGVCLYAVWVLYRGLTI